MKFVYLLQNVSHPEQHYTGLTADVDKRLVAHNSGQSAHTAKYRPWQQVLRLAFADESKATSAKQLWWGGTSTFHRGRALYRACGLEKCSFPMDLI